MTAITGEQYYKDHIAEEKEYVPVFAAYPIRKGQPLNDGTGRPAKEDGYEIGGHFYTKDEFAAATIPADDLPLPEPRNHLSPEQRADLLPVKKGDEVTCIDQDGQEYVHTATHDGFLVSYGAEKIFMSNFDFSDCFNDAVSTCHTEADPVTVIVKNKASPMKGILIPRSMWLTLIDDEFRARAGSILMNGGFTINNIFSFNYRLTKGTVAAEAAVTAHSRALDAQADLKKKWLRKKAARTSPG